VPLTVTGIHQEGVSRMKKGILLHEADDDVGVATMDLSAGETVEALTLEGVVVAEVPLAEDVPLSHKVAMRTIAADAPVTEYGREIGAASADITVGTHVHTHNLRSQRWSGRSQIVEHGAGPAGSTSGKETS
jgi:(2R)-sulfolactate sulfo-lyase subunit alpha